MLCGSLLTNDGVLAADKTIKYNAESSVLKLRGREIRLDEKQFLLLFEAYSRRSSSDSPERG